MYTSVCTYMNIASVNHKGGVSSPNREVVYEGALLKICLYCQKHLKPELEPVKGLGFRFWVTKAESPESSAVVSLTPKSPEYQLQVLLPHLVPGCAGGIHQGTTALPQRF